MSDREFPSDIWQLAGETLVSIVADGLGRSDPDELLALKRHIANGLLIERERLQADVIAAVADESEDCRNRVFKALRRAISQ